MKTGWMAKCCRNLQLEFISIWLKVVTVGPLNFPYSFGSVQIMFGDSRPQPHDPALLSPLQNQLVQLFNALIQSFSCDSTSCLDVPRGPRSELLHTQLWLDGGDAQSWWQVLFVSQNQDRGVNQPLAFDNFEKL